MSGGMVSIYGERGAVCWDCWLVLWRKHAGED